ncbi:cellulase family glycosylhydrolase [Haliscomenobacter sp.]|uniref:cellulase family glycosylhydrolase n=1 Tax=Haliscomenobacter sp. TaxID=2717303 RepID=UPI003593BF9F
MRPIIETFASDVQRAKTFYKQAFDENFFLLSSIYHTLRFRYLLLLCIFCSPIAAQAQTLQLLPQNPHYFQYQGKPIVIVGSGEHYGAVLNQGFDYTRYLKSMKADGLNTTRLFMGAYYEKPGAFGIEKNTLAPNETQLILPWQQLQGKYDLTRWNEAYFKRLHDFMKKATENGVIVEINLFSAYYGSGWAYHPFHGQNNLNGTPSDLPSQQVNTLNNGKILQFQEAYVRKMVKELNPYGNFYFEIQNEPWADSKDTVLIWNDYIRAEELIQPGNNWKNTLEVPSEASFLWHQRVSSWIVGEEKTLPQKHLVSHNIANFKQPVSPRDPNISIYTFHYAAPESVTLNYGLNKVIGFNETGFAGKNDDTYRRQAWRFMLSGGGLFGHLDYSYSVDSPDGHEATGSSPGGGSLQLRAYFKVLRQFLDQLDLRTLRPNSSFLGHTEGAFVYSMKDLRHWVVYLEHLSVNPAKLRLQLPKGNYSLSWLDVQTGQNIKTEKLTVSGSFGLITSPTPTKDMVLKINKN